MSYADQGTATVRATLVGGGSSSAVTPSADVLTFLKVIAGTIAVGYGVAIVGHHLTHAGRKR